MNVKENKKYSVLIVDDEKANIYALTRILSPEYNIYAAKDGPDAVEIANEFLPDVILLDILMPDMDGYKVIKSLKGSEKTVKIPVIFVSGLSEAEDEEKGLYEGAADYINKPFRSATVKLRVRSQIQILEYIRVIEELNVTDQLTKLPNRRGFDERIRIEWNRAARDRTPVSVLIIDLDDFRRYNDMYGRRQGDSALQITAKIFTKELKRSVDFIARWGGEEFIVLLPNTDFPRASIVAERLRLAAENSGISLSDEKTAAVTVSIGENTTVPSAGQTIDDFISLTEKALDAAKNNGKNRICGYDGPDRVDLFK